MPYLLRFDGLVFCGAILLQYCQLDTLLHVYLLDYCFAGGCRYSAFFAFAIELLIEVEQDYSAIV